MDYIEYYTFNREFKIVLYKKKKSFYYDKFSQYECHIDFRNSINQSIVDIKCNEKNIMSALESLNNFQMNMGGIISDTIHFENNGDMRNYFMYISEIEVPETVTTLSDIDDEKGLQISIYEEYLGQNVLRLYFEFNYFYLEDLIYQIYLLVEDIPYLNEISNSLLLEYMDYSGFQIPQ